MRLSRILVTVFSILLAFGCSRPGQMGESNHGSGANFSNNVSPDIVKYGGYIQEDPQEILKKIKPYYSVLTRAALPASVDLTPQMPPVISQIGNSCVAFSSAAAKTYYEGIQENWDVTDPAHQISGIWIYRQVNGEKNEGAFMTAALELIKQNGADTVAAYPNTDGYREQPDFESMKRAVRFKNQNSLFVGNGNVEGMRAALAEGKVLVGGGYVDDNFGGITPENPVWDTLTTGGGGHAIVFVGYDDNKVSKNGKIGAFKIQNSWGNDWGTWRDDNDPGKGRGFGWISYDVIRQRNFDAYIMVDDVNISDRIVSRLATPRWENAISGNVPLIVEAYSGSGIAKVEFYLGGNKVGEDSIAENLSGKQVFVLNINSASYSNGFYNLKVITRDNAGRELVSEWVRIMINNTGLAGEIINPINQGSVTGIVPIKIKINNPNGTSAGRLKIWIDGDLFQNIEYPNVGSELTYNWDTSGLSTDKDHIIAVWVFQSGTDHYTIRETSVRLAPDQEAPVVQITSPVQGSVVAGIVNVQATATDNVGVDRLEFKLYTTGETLCVDNTAPYTCEWDATNNWGSSGDAQGIIATAYDKNGNSSTAIVTVSPFQCRQFSDTNYKHVAAGRAVKYVSGWSTKAKTVGKGDDLGTYGSAYYSPTTIVAETAPGYFIKGTCPDLISPQISITSPSDGQTVSGTITFSSQATDNVGVTKVQYGIPAIPFGLFNLLCESTQAPFSCQFNTRSLENGEYDILAGAYDAAGNVGESQLIRIIVNNPPVTCQQWTAKNTEHVAAGRAIEYIKYYTKYAKTVGKGDELGFNNAYTTTTVKETAPGYFEKGTCN